MPIIGSMKRLLIISIAFADNSYHNNLISHAGTVLMQCDYQEAYGKEPKYV